MSETHGRRGARSPPPSPAKFEPPHGEEKDASCCEVPRRLETAAAILSYSTCSIGMIILNKLVIAKYNINFPMSLLFFQNLAALVIVALMRQLGLVDYPPPEWAVIRRWLPLTVLFIVMLVTSLLALRTMSVPVQTLIKNLAIVTTALGDYHLFGHPLTPAMWAAFALMIVGSMLGAGTDAWVTAAGLFWSVLNALSTTAYQLYMKGMLNDLKKTMGRWGPVYYNNLLSLPFLVVPTLMTAGGWSVALAESGTWARVWLALMLLVAAAMTMSSFWCMRATNPTTYGVVGGMNKIPLSAFGIVIFEQYPDRYGALGICVALSGGLLYTYSTTVAARRQSVAPLSPPVTRCRGEEVVTPPSASSRAQQQPLQQQQA